MLNKFRDGFLLEIIVFVSGAIVMIYEIIGSRILAPYIGTSTYVWTSLIGVILGSLSLGYWLGGKYADRQPNSKILAAVLFAASVLVAVTMLLQEFVLAGLSMFSMRLELKAILAALILFAPASVLFGFVTPYAVRLKMISVEDAGKTVGRLYALSTVGSILGTFVAGFILLPFVGSVRTLYIIVAVLFLSSLLLAPFKLTAKKVAAIVFFICAVGANEFIRYTLAKTFDLHDFDTRYNRIRVWQGYDAAKDLRVRVVSTDPFSTQSSMYLDSDELASKYVGFFHLLRHFNPNFQKTLKIGGAGYSFPKDYLRKYPGKQIDVVEIDPGMTETARKYFRLPDDENLKIFHEDGRAFLNRTGDKYDAIVVDVFGAMFSVPFQLTTVEAVQKMHNALNEDGVVIVNLISAIEGEQSYFFQSEFKTYRSVFPNVFVYTLHPKSSGQGTQNLILVASKSKNVSLESNDDEIATLLKNRYEKPFDLTVPVLTDDFAPVEYYNSFAQKTVNVGDERIKNKVNQVLKKFGF